jgi:hypothetical protein
VIENEKVKKEDFSIGEEKDLPVIERIPDNVRAETIYLNKWHKVKPAKELMKEIGNGKPTVENVGDHMIAFILREILHN